MMTGLHNNLLALALCCAAGVCIASDLPNRSLTPGAINPDVRQDNIQTTICVKGYTKTIRPPAYYTNRLKKQQIREYGYSEKNPKLFEEDHLVPLSSGGHPTDPKNLWPEPRHTEWGAERKDQLEFAMYKAICRGEIGLEEAQRAFAVDWIASYKKYGYLLSIYHARGFSD